MEPILSELKVLGLHILLAHADFVELLLRLMANDAGNSLSSHVCRPSSLATHALFLFRLAFHLTFHLAFQFPL